MLDISRPDVHKISLRHGEIYRYEPKNKFNHIKLPIFFSSDEAACVYRDNSCFMRVKIVRTGENIPRETQYILAREGNTYRLIYALSDNGTRACLNSSESGTEVTLDTYSDEPLGSVTEFLYTVCGENPYKREALPAPPAAGSGSHRCEMPNPEPAEFPLSDSPAEKLSDNLPGFPPPKVSGCRSGYCHTPWNHFCHTHIRGRH